MPWADLDDQRQGEEEMGVQKKSDERERGRSETTKQEQQRQDRRGYP